MMNLLVYYKNMMKLKYDKKTKKIK